MAKYKVGDEVWVKLTDAPELISCRLLSIVKGKYGTICECEPLDPVLRSMAGRRLGRPYIRLYDTHIVQPPALGLFGEVLENSDG